MEAGNAARAMQELYATDRDTALDVMLGLPARKAAAIMDALAASKPSLAAEFPSEMSHRDEPRAQQLRRKPTRSPPTRALTAGPW